MSIGAGGDQDCASPVRQYIEAKVQKNRFDEIITFQNGSTLKAMRAAALEQYTGLKEQRNNVAANKIEQGTVETSAELLNRIKIALRSPIKSQAQQTTESSGSARQLRRSDDPERNPLALSTVKHVKTIKALPTPAAVTVALPTQSQPQNLRIPASNSLWKTRKQIAERTERAVENKQAIPVPEVSSQGRVSALAALLDEAQDEISANKAKLKEEGKHDTTKADLRSKLLRSMEQRDKDDPSSGSLHDTFDTRLFHAASSGNRRKRPDNVDPGQPRKVMRFE